MYTGLPPDGGMSCLVWSGLVWSGLVWSSLVGMGRELGSIWLQVPIPISVLGLWPRTQNCDRHSSLGPNGSEFPSCPDQTSPDKTRHTPIWGRPVYMSKADKILTSLLVTLSYIMFCLPTWLTLTILDTMVCSKLAPNRKSVFYIFMFIFYMRRDQTNYPTKRYQWPWWREMRKYWLRGRLIPLPQRWMIIFNLFPY